MMVTLDPNKAYPEAKKGDLVEACGIIPQFFFAAAVENKKTAKEAYETMVSEYGFGDWSSTSWGTIDPKGTYVSSSEGDQDLEPYMELVMLDGPTLYIYPHAILAVVDSNDTIISRMD